MEQNVFLLPLVYPSGDSLLQARADLDGDGDLDLFITNENSEPNEIWNNDGTGTFTNSGQALGTSNSKNVSLGDIDGDGDLRLPRATDNNFLLKQA